MRDNEWQHDARTQRYFFGYGSKLYYFNWFYWDTIVPTSGTCINYNLCCKARVKFKQHLHCMDWSTLRRGGGGQKLLSTWTYHLKIHNFTHRAQLNQSLPHTNSRPTERSRYTCISTWLAVSHQQPHTRRKYNCKELRTSIEEAGDWSSQVNWQCLWRPNLFVYYYQYQAFNLIELFPFQFNKVFYYYTNKIGFCLPDRTCWFTWPQIETYSR